MAIPRPIRLAGAVAFAIATYLVAYRHGQSAGARAIGVAFARHRSALRSETGGVPGR